MTRLVSGIVLAAAALAAILLLPPTPLRLLVCVIAVLAAREYVRVVGSSPAALGGVVVSCWIASAGSPPYLLPVAGVVLLLVVLDVLVAGEPIQQASAGAVAVLYIGVPLGLLAAVHAQHGWRATVLLLSTVVASDTAQYYAGRLFGRRLLAPAISPKKTWEGAIGGVVAGTVLMAAAGAWVFPGASVPALGGLGLVLVVLGIAGDLFESRLKRQAAVKDSSSLIPGHGGVLDRIDALLFAIPAFYVYALAATGGG